MSDTQLFQLLGLAMFPIGVGMLAHPDVLKKIFKNLEHDPAAVYLSGFVSLFLGYALVAFHNTWQFDRSLIITLVGWSALIKGLSLLLFPTSLFGATRKFTDSDRYRKCFPWYPILFGLVLLYFGFFA
ncbi:MAG: hypothetical protein HGB37_01735 [Candidatus Moranbacteria bacterium]|jgi:uncharacterized membrane protein|nr:hypothetical protein [Candidatus Moranbacteria bacterium]